MFDLHAGGAALALLALMLGLSWAVRYSAGTTLDFYLARRNVGTVLNACAICGDYFSAASFLGVAASVYAFGLDGVWFATGFAAGFLILLLFLAAPLRRAGHFSIPDFLAQRFDSQAVRVVAVVIVELIVFIYLLPQMVGAGLTWSALVGEGFAGMSPYVSGIVLSTAVISTQAAMGGMRATTWNQALMFCLMFFGVLVVALVLLADGFSYPDAVERASRRPLAAPASIPAAELTPERLRAARAVMTPAAYERAERSIARGDERVDLLLPVRDQLHGDGEVGFGEPGGRYSLWESLGLLATLLLGTASLPHLVNRYLTSVSGRSARRATVWAVGLAVVFYFLAVMLGVGARERLPELVGPARTDALFVDSVARSPEQVLLLLADALGGGPLLAIVSVAALAAILDTVGGLLIAAAVSWGHDVFEQFVDPYASERRRVAFGRAAVISTAVVAALAGIVIPQLGGRPSVAVMVTWAFALGGSALTPVFLLAVWWKRTSAAGAVAGMLTGAGVAFAAIIADLAGGPELPFGPFSAIVAAPAALLVTLAVSTRRAAPEPQRAWLRMHGTAPERRQALLADLVSGEAAP